MTPVRYSLVFASTLCLLSACGDEPSARPSAPKPQVSVTREPVRPAAALLTSAAPSAPRSILDAKPAAPTPSPAAQPASTASGEPDEHGAEASAPHVSVERFVLTTGIEGREPVDVRDTFNAAETGIFAFLQLANEAGPDAQVMVHFERTDEPKLPYGIALEVPKAPRWRTWAVTRIAREPGQYRAVVRTKEGLDLAEQAFEIVAGGAR